MFTTLPQNALLFVERPWSQIAPYYQDLRDRPLDEATLPTWLADWSRLSELVNEAYQRLWVATTVNTTDQQAEARYVAFLDHLYPLSQAADQELKQKLLNSGLQVDGMQRPIMNLRAEAGIFRQANLSLLAEELKLSTEYDRIIGAQTIDWEGQELTILQAQTIYLDLDRQKRERAWRAATARQLADRQAINDLWQRFMAVRSQITRNAALPDYRAYRWQKMWRFDYTPQDCRRFHQAIEQVAVPAASRLYERRRRKLGLETLRPWDLNVDPDGLPPLRPFEKVMNLEEKTAAIFQQVDPQLGAYFEIMRSEGLLDLDNRKGKAPGGYCTEYFAIHRPFIFMNAVGIHDDVQTLIHEGGHAFHVFETATLPYIHQRQAGLEFLEVASMSMELIASPYLEASAGGFYTPQDAARARIEHLEAAVCFWPYMAVVDAFQHWVYENHQAASDPANCDAQWEELWQRFMPGVDWSGFDEERITGWQRKGHIHQDPFYYIEYGLAQLGAFQVWRNALNDQAAAVTAYRKALSLGGTVSTPELYTAAGARFAFDVETLQQVVDLAEETIEKLEQQYV